MKQKYIVLKNPETNDLFIREFNEAEKGYFVACI